MSSTSERDLIALVNGNDRAKIVASSSSSLSSALFTTSRKITEQMALLVLGKKDRQRWSFQELAACARSFANGLVRQDFKRGDAVALIAENSPEWIAAVLGIIRAGMVAVPLDVQLGDETLVH